MAVKTPIYLDNCATTPVDPAVVDVMTRVLRETPGNPSSIHDAGRRAAAVVSEARATIAASIGANPKEIVFTSSGTEANNLVINTALVRESGLPAQIVTSATEHASIYKRLQYEERVRGDALQVDWVCVDSSGRLDVDDLNSRVSESTRLLTILHCNNETGVLQDIDALFALKHKYPRMLLHLDIVQSYMKLPFDVRTAPVDLFSVSAHKIYGPKGIGFLYVRGGVDVEPLFLGGAQEKFRRAGTENVAGIAGFAEAVRHMPSHDQLRTHYMNLETSFFSVFDARSIEYRIVTGDAARMPGMFNLAFPGVVNKEDVQIACDLEGVMLSSTSACHSGVVSDSHVLTAMGVCRDELAGSVRICFNRFHTSDEITRAAKIIASVILRIRQAAPAQAS